MTCEIAFDWRSIWPARLVNLAGTQLLSDWRGVKKSFLRRVKESVVQNLRLREERCQWDQFSLDDRWQDTQCWNLELSYKDLFCRGLSCHIWTKRKHSKVLARICRGQNGTSLWNRICKHNLNSTELIQYYGCLESGFQCKTWLILEFEVWMSFPWFELTDLVDIQASLSLRTGWNFPLTSLVFKKKGFQFNFQLAMFCRLHVDLV